MAENTQENHLHLRVTVGDITIEADGPIDETETWFEALREDYLSDIDVETLGVAANESGTISQDTGDKKGTQSGSNGSASSKSRSLTEYYKQADNPTKQDSALIVGWYLEYKEDQSNFTKPEVEQRAKGAKISLGANISRDLSKQVKNSHLEEVDERDGQDAYHLTITGEEYVQDELL